MSSILNILGIAVIGNMAAYWFLPIQSAKSKLIDLFRFIPFFHKAIDKALNCSKCMSFWVYLIIYQDVVGAALCSFVGYLINFSIDKINAWYEG